MTFRPRRIVDSAATLLAVVAVAASLLSRSASYAQFGQTQSGQTYVMKLSTTTLKDPQEEWLDRFATAVAKDSGGRFKPEVYNASTLGSIPRQIEGTQFGAIQAWIGPPDF